MSGIAGGKGETISVELIPSCEAQSIKSALQQSVEDELKRKVGVGQWLSPVAFHEVSKIPIGTLQGFVGAILESAGEVNTGFRTLALVKCDGSYGHTLCRSWDLCAEYTTEEANEDMIFSRTFDISSELAHAAACRLANTRLHEGEIPSPEKGFREEKGFRRPV